MIVLKSLSALRSCIYIEAVKHTTQSLLQLLLGAQLVAVSALLLAAVNSAGVKASVALAADNLVAVVLAGQHLERGLNDATPEAEHQVEGGLCMRSKKKNKVSNSKH